MRIFHKHKWVETKREFGSAIDGKWYFFTGQAVRRPAVLITYQCEEDKRRKKKVELLCGY